MMGSFPWLSTRIHIVNPSLSHTSVIPSSRLRTAEQFRKGTQRGHNMLPSLIIKRVCSAWLVRGKAETRGTHTVAARFASLYLWGNDLMIQASAIKSPAVLSYTLVKFLLPFEFCHSRKLLMLHIILVSAMIIKHLPPEVFCKQ